MKVEQVIFVPLLLLVLATSCPAQEVAVIDTNIFGYTRKGITRLVKAMESVDREFEPRRAELLQMHERLQKQLEKFSFAGPIPTDPEPMTPERRRRTKAEAEEMRRLVAQKEEETQRVYSRRIREVTAPINDDIRKSLEAFAKARGIMMLLDASKLACLVGCDRESTAAIDVTQEFIAEYNRLKQ